MCVHSVAKSCPTLCNHMDGSTPGFSALHYLPEMAQIHVHSVSDAIQPSHPLLSPSPFKDFLVAQLVKNPPAMQETGFDPWAGKIPWRRERLPIPVFWPEELDCIVHGVAKSQAQMNNFHFLSAFKGMTLLRYQTRCFIIVSDVMFIH